MNTHQEYVPSRFHQVSAFIAALADLCHEHNFNLEGSQQSGVFQITRGLVEYAYLEGICADKSVVTLTTE